MKDIIKILLTKDYFGSNEKSSLCRTRMIVSIILGLAAGAMLITNIKNNSMVMAYSSIVLVVGFAISAILAGVVKHAAGSAHIIGLLVALVLSAFAITGGNNGFAILWVLLVPMFSISLIGVIPGLVLSTYFCIFICVLFLTPLSSYIDGKYTADFIKRFPTLYLCDFAVATYFALQRDYYQKKLHLQAFTDSMTGLLNRRTFMDTLETIKGDYSIVMVDLNGLKIVNDTHGHEAGDEFIMAVSKICADEFSDNAKVCRIGGDEFAIIVKGDKELIERQVEKLHERASAMQSGVNFKLSFSTGVAHSKDYPAKGYEELFKRADEIMYKNKMLYYEDNKHNRR